MAFLSQYRTLRKSSGDEVLEEVEYNFGRAFHQLGTNFPFSFDTVYLIIFVKVFTRTLSRIMSVFLRLLKSGETR